jgi:hypothetical protein
MFPCALSIIQMGVLHFLCHYIISHLSYKEFTANTLTDPKVSQNKDASGHSAMFSNAQDLGLLSKI